MLDALLAEFISPRSAAAREVEDLGNREIVMRDEARVLTRVRELEIPGGPQEIGGELGEKQSGSLVQESI